MQIQASESQDEAIADKVSSQSTSDLPGHLQPPDPELAELLSSNPWLDMLSTRTRNCLQQAEITTLADLQEKKPEELLAIPQFGYTCLEEVKWFLRIQDLLVSESEEEANWREAMANGVPIMCASITGGKLEVCNRVSYSRVGINLKTNRSTPRQAHKAVKKVLFEPSYRQRVRQLQAEFA